MSTRRSTFHANAAPRRLATAAIVLAAALPCTVWAEPTAKRPVAAAPAHAATFELDLAGLEPIDPGLRAELAKAIHSAAAEIATRRGLPAEKIHVRIAWQDQDDVDYAVRIHFDAHEWMPASDHPATTGPDASASGLTEVVTAALERSLGEWERRHDATRPPPPKPITIAPASVEVVDDAPRRRRLGALGWAGVGLSIAGAGALGGGIAAVIIDRTVDPSDPVRLQDWHYTGYALVGVGAAAIIAGSVMAIVDARKRRARAVASAPVPLRRGAGVAFSIAF